MTRQVRKYLYGVTIALVAVLVAYDVIIAGQGKVINPGDGWHQPAG